MTKSQIRQEIKLKRKQLNKEILDVVSRTIAAKVVQDEIFQDSDFVLLYAAFWDEIQTQSIDEWAKSHGKKVAYPKIDMQSGIMDFYHVKLIEELEKHAFKNITIDEPNPLFHPKIIPGKGDVIIVPGVAFDLNGNRVGYGGGFYDRYLERYNYLHKTALCMDFQLFEEVPSEVFDIKMDQIVTEKRKVCYFHKDDIQ